MLFISQLISQRGTNPYLENGSRPIQAPGVVWQLGVGGGLSPAKATLLIDDLAFFGAPFVVFSAEGGDLREDLLTLIERARLRGMTTVLAIDRISEMAGYGRHLAGAGLSLLLVEATVHDAETFLSECRREGLSVGVGQSLTSAQALTSALSLTRQAGCSVCVLTHPAVTQTNTELHTRELMDQVYEAAFQESFQIVTRGNRADAVYMYLKLRREYPDLAKQLRAAMFGEGTARVYVETAYVGANGDVFPEEHWRWGAVGSVREKLFSKIWTDPQHPLLRGFRSRRLLVQGRCRICGYLHACGGNQRTRASAAGDLWAADPGCYLTDDEIQPNPR